MLPFVTVHRVVDDKVTLWKDYWDMGTLTSCAPSTWLETLIHSRHVVDVRRDRHESERITGHAPTLRRTPGVSPSRWASFRK